MRLRLARRPIVLALLVLISIAYLFPFFWVVSSALQTTREQSSLPLTWIPQVAQLSNFVVAWTTLPFTHYLLNTLFIVVLATVGAVASAACCAYGFARIRFFARTFWFNAVLSTMMLPFIVTLIPVYLIMRDLGWLDTFWPMIVPAWFGGGPFNIFLLRQFMKGIPQDLLDAAKVDGAGHATTFLRIVIPLVKPALAVAAWYTAVASWGDLMFPLIFISTQEKWTLALALSSFSKLKPPGWGTQLEMAIAVVMTAPVLIGFFVLQHWLIEGVNLTGRQ